MGAQGGVLLLNPPGDRIYIRDYYCSKVSKAHYTYQPVDLVVLSGIIGASRPVRVIDAIVEKLSGEECIDRVLQGNEEAIVFLAGAASLRNDFGFMRRLRERTRARLIGSGDLFMESSGAILADERWLDAICLDFTSPDILAYLDAPDAARPLAAIACRAGGAVIAPPRVRATGHFQIPIPRHELFPNAKYTYPFVRRSPFVTVLTDYGCPHHCTFCIMSQLGYKVRGVPNVMEELDYVVSLGIREVYFSDQTFGGGRERLRALCREMLRRDLRLGWVCFLRVDLADGETLSLMKEAGCHTIIFGVESGSDRVLRESGKGITTEMVREAFSLCARQGIMTVGTFMLGLPGDDARSIRQTIAFARQLRCDYASFNVPVPRMLTPLRRWAIEKEMITSGLQEMDQSGTTALMHTRHISRRKVMQLKREAIFGFYLRPSYLLHRFLTIDSLWDLKRHVLGLFSLVKNTFSRG
ncbi:MAG: radical SAM protein [Chlamydiota bacterium]